MLTTILGVALIVVGAIALAYRTITFFTKEKVVDAGPLEISASRPHTIVMNPLVGAVMLAAGIVLLMMRT